MTWARRSIRIDPLREVALSIVGVNASISPLAQLAGHWCDFNSALATCHVCKFLICWPMT